MAYATRAYKKHRSRKEQLIFQCASNESILRRFYNWGRIKSFENWLQLSTVEKNCRARSVRARLRRHYYALSPKLARANFILNWAIFP